MKFKICINFVWLHLQKMLMTMEQDHMNLKIENASLKAANSQQNKKVRIFFGLWEAYKKKIYLLLDFCIRGSFM